MRAGLLECDHVRVAWREAHGDYSDMFVHLFPELEWRFYDVCNGHFPDRLDECEVYFATGSHRSVYEQEAWILQLKDTIRAIAKEGKYFVGFCFGHQLLAEAMGGAVRKSPHGWCVGVHAFDVRRKEAWMQPFRGSLNLLMMCQDQVLELPPAATILAASSLCPVGMFRIGDRMLGVQGHPEFSKAYDRLLMESRAPRIGEEEVQKARRSFGQEVHQEVIKRWVLNFLGFTSPT